MSARYKAAAAIVQPDPNKRTKLEWIESAAPLKHERFEVAGALFNVGNDELLSEQEVKTKLDAYLGIAVPEQEPVKEEGNSNVDSTE